MNALTVSLENAPNLETLLNQSMQKWSLRFAGVMFTVKLSFIGLGLSGDSLFRDYFRAVSKECTKIKTIFL